MSTIKIPQRSYLLPTPVLVEIMDRGLIGIKYYSDCVFKPHIFGTFLLIKDINFKIRPVGENES